MVADYPEFQLIKLPIELKSNGLQVISMTFSYSIDF